jgi:hypothetical protein
MVDESMRIEQVTLPSDSVHISESVDDESKTIPRSIVPTELIAGGKHDVFDNRPFLPIEGQEMNEESDADRSEPVSPGFGVEDVASAEKPEIRNRMGVREPEEKEDEEEPLENVRS